MNIEQAGDKLPQLMCVLYGCIKSLAHKPIRTVIPQLLTVKCCDGPHIVASENCVICEKKKCVIKMYDFELKQYLKPNQELLQAKVVETKNLQLLYIIP